MELLSKGMPKSCLIETIKEKGKKRLNQVLCTANRYNYRSNLVICWVLIYGFDSAQIWCMDLTLAIWVESLKNPVLSKTVNRWKSLLTFIRCAGGQWRFPKSLPLPLPCLESENFHTRPGGSPQGLPRLWFGIPPSWGYQFHQVSQWTPETQMAQRQWQWNKQVGRPAGQAHPASRGSHSSSLLLALASNSSLPTPTHSPSQWLL